MSEELLEPAAPDYNNLTDAQKLIILKLWNSRTTNPPTLNEMARAAWPDLPKDTDGRHNSFRTVKKFLATRNVVARSDAEPEKKEDENPLTNSEKEFIANNARFLGPMELAKTIYKDQFLRNFSPETRRVVAYLKTLDPKVTQRVNPDGSKIEQKESDGGYVPPRSLIQARARVNKAILNCLTEESINENQKIKNNLNCLIKFCHHDRFVRLMDGFENEEDKELFENTFIRYLWDKGDGITEEELDLYINLCCMPVDQLKMRDELRKLQVLFDEQSTRDNEDGKKVAVSMSIVESINNLRKDLKESEKNHNSLVKALQGNRETRIKLRIEENQSFAALVNAWKVRDEGREKLIKQAEERMKEVTEEKVRLETLDDVLIEIYGGTK